MATGRAGHKHDSTVERTRRDVHRGRARRGTRSGTALGVWLLRVAVAAHLVAAFAQPLSAGVYLSGNVNGLTWHLNGADGVSAAAALQLLLAIVVWATARRAWPFVASIALVAAEWVVYEAGNEGALWLHIPLAVLLIVGLAAMMLAVWLLPLPRRRRAGPNATDASSPAPGDDG